MIHLMLTCAKNKDAEAEAPGRRCGKRRSETLHPFRIVSIVFLLGATLGILLNQNANCQTPAAGGETSIPQSAGELAAQARLAYETGDLATAKRLFNAQLEQNRDELSALEGLAMLQADLGNMNASIPLLERAAAIAPASEPVLTNLANAYLKARRYKDAVPVLERAMKAQPASGPLKAEYGQALMGLARYREAATALEAASAAVPANADYKYDWALALFSEKKFGEAAAILEAMPGKEESAAVQALLADIDDEEGRMPQAVGHYYGAARLNPDTANIDALGLELLRHGNYAAANKVYKFGLESFPEEKRMLLGLGLAEYGSNRFGSAAEIFEGLLKRDASNLSYASFLGRSCKLLMDATVQACGELVRYATHHPEQEEVVISAAAYLLNHPEADSLNTAQDLLAQAHLRYPRSSQICYLTGELYQHHLRWEASLAPLEEAVTLDPHLAEAHYKLAQAYFKTGKREAGAREIQAFRQAKGQQE